MTLESATPATCGPGFRSFMLTGYLFELKANRKEEKLTAEVTQSKQKP